MLSTLIQHWAALHDQGASSSADGPIRHKHSLCQQTVMCPWCPGQTEVLGEATSFQFHWSFVKMTLFNFKSNHSRPWAFSFFFVTLFFEDQVTCSLGLSKVSGDKISEIPKVPIFYCQLPVYIFHANNFYFFLLVNRKVTTPFSQHAGGEGAGGRRQG